MSREQQPAARAPAEHRPAHRAPGPDHRSPPHTAVLRWQRTAGNRATVQLLGAAPTPVQRKTAFWDLKPRTFLDRLMKMPRDEALNRISVTSNLKLLRKAQARLLRGFSPRGGGPLQPEELSVLLDVGIMLARRITLVEKATEIATIARKAGRGLSPADTALVEKALSGFAEVEQKQIEKEIVTWPTHIAPKAKKQVTELITGPIDPGLLQQAQAHFDPERGQQVRDDLEAARQGMDEDSSKCLRFLEIATSVTSEGLNPFGMDEDARKTADTRYGYGNEERDDNKLFPKATLSRLAGELRVQGLLGPVRFSPWAGTPGKGGHKDPTPKEVLDQLSPTSLGDGWYFFLVSQFGHHTRMMAVEVVDGHRTYTLLEHLVFESGPAKGVRVLDDAKVNATFDNFGRPDPDAVHGTRFWPVYARRDQLGSL